MRTVVDIVEDAVSDGLGLPRSPMQLDVLKEALARYQKCGKIIFDMVNWDNGKIPYFQTDDTDATLMTSYDTATGIITFGSSIDILRAIRPIDPANLANENYALWAQNQVNAAVNGLDVSPGRFIPMNDDANGNRRIQVQIDDGITTYKIVAVKRFVPAIIDDAYDYRDPSATPTDYRVLTWPIDHSDPAIVAYMADELRTWDGQTAKNDWTALVQVAINKTENMQARDKAVYPQDPMFDSYEDDYNDSTWDSKSF